MSDSAKNNVPVGNIILMCEIYLGLEKVSSLAKKKEEDICLYGKIGMEGLVCFIILE